MSRGGLSWARAALAGVVLIAAGLLAPSPSAADLSDTIARIKPAIVSVGTYQQLRRPPSLLLGGVNQGYLTDATRASGK